MPLLHLGSLSRRVTKSDLLHFLDAVGGLDRQRVGRIELRGKEATIEVPDGWESRLVKALDGQLLGDRRVRAWAESLPDSSHGEEEHFQIAVIAPYAAQVRLLRELLSVPGLEIDSVDGFQGRDKEAVVISLVRSNSRSEIGFLGDVRRMNVAMTRARRKLLVVGDSATLSGHVFYRRLIDYFEGVSAYRTVWEEETS